MVTAVNTQALASSVSGNGRAEKPDTEPQLKQPDSGDKSAPSAADLQAVVVKISAEGASRAAAGGQVAPSTEDIPAGQDIDGDGKATAHEFRDGAPKAPQTRVTVAQQGPSAVPAGGLPRVSSADGGASPLSTSSKTYDPADANEDGTVSAQEGQAYGAKLAADKAAQAASAVKTYQAVEQLSQASGTATT